MRAKPLLCLMIVMVAYCAGAHAANKHKKPSCGDNLKPEYTEKAKEAKVEGTAVLVAVVTTEGCVSRVELEKGLGYGLDQKAIQAVRTWKFTPSMKDGMPVAVQMRIEVPFKLPPGSSR